MIGQTVRAYHNLKTGKVSLLTRTAKGWRLADSVGSAVLADVVLTVREAARQRVLRTGQREVHAWAEGTLLATSSEAGPPPRPCEQVRYNPFRGPYFTLGGQPIHGQRALLVSGGAAYAIPASLLRCLPHRQVSS